MSATPERRDSIFVADWFERLCIMALFLAAGLFIGWMKWKKGW